MTKYVVEKVTKSVATDGHWVILKGQVNPILVKPGKNFEPRYKPGDVYKEELGALYRQAVYEEAARTEGIQPVSLLQSCLGCTLQLLLFPAMLSVGAYGIRMYQERKRQIQD